MIEYIKGEITELTPVMTTIECHGVGYGIHITLNSYTTLQEQKEGKLYIHEVIREDTYTLFGFVEKRERELFLLLISVSGVGASTANMILSSFTVEELQKCIVGENVAMLKAVKGIGIKTAQRIILDLKDKLKNVTIDPTQMTKEVQQNSAIREEAIAALKTLGFIPASATKAVDKVLKKTPTASVEILIKQALQLL